MKANISIPSTIVGLTAVATLSVCLTILGPLLTMWSLNVLFEMGIPLTWTTFAATFWLLVVLKSIRSFK